MAFTATQATPVPLASIGIITTQFPPIPIRLSDVPFLALWYAARASKSSSPEEISDFPPFRIASDASRRTELPKGPQYLLIGLAAAAIP